jgi:alkylation response protein AidB-like acyl-CoA dehydrogenase
MPKRWGGLEFGVETFIDCMLEIGEVCPSTAWSTNFITEHNWLASHFSEEAQREFFGAGRYISAPGTSTPMGKAVRVPGGYRLSGHYRFGSGVMNADWVFGMGLVEGEEIPNPRWFAVPAKEVKVLDTWYVEGLAGTGSNDFLVEDLFVPERRVIVWGPSVNMASEGSKLHANPMYRMPPVQFLSFCVTLTTVGAGRGIVKAYRESVMKGRARWGESVKQHEKPAAQIRVARADLLAHSAELTLRDMARGMMRMAEGSMPADDLNRTKLVAQAAMAANLAHESATVALRGAGTSVHALAQPFQRLMRDINVSSSHAVSEFDEVGEQYGRCLFGLEPTSPMR